MSGCEVKIVCRIYEVIFNLQALPRANSGFVVAVQKPVNVGGEFHFSCIVIIMMQF
jgi:hypothetical protein